MSRVNRKLGLGCTHVGNFNDGLATGRITDRKNSLTKRCHPTTIDIGLTSQQLHVFKR
jgi:hypothetical protein